MADYRAIANVAAAVQRHLQDISGRVLQSEPVRLCKPAELATSEGIAICVWRVVAAPRNNVPPLPAAPGSMAPQPAAFDLHFLGTSALQDVVGQHEHLGWLLWALASAPVIPAGNLGLDAHQRPLSSSEETVRLVIDQLDEETELSLRAALGLTAPTVSFVARSALISLGGKISPPPVLTRPMR